MADEYTSRSSEDQLLLDLASSSTTKRVYRLVHLSEQIKREEIPIEQLPFVLRLLFASHPYYVDRQSRKAVRKCFQTLSETPAYSDTYIKRIVPAIKSEAVKKGIAASNAFVLSEWVADLLPLVAAKKGPEDLLFAELVATLVALLNLTLGSPLAKEGVKSQTLRAIRRCLRAVFKSDENGKITIVIVKKLTAKGPSPNPENSMLLGIISGVAARLPKAKEHLFAVKRDIYEYYAREVLGSRAPVPVHIVRAFNDFFPNFTTAEDFYEIVLPPLEKSLLRSPEVILNDVASPLLSTLPAEVDLAKAVHEKLLKHFLSSLKSSNPVIRNGAVDAFRVAVAKCRDQTAVGKIAQEILTPVKGGKVPSAEHRTLYAGMLDAIPPTLDLAKTILVGLTGVVAKEPNEQAHTALISAFVTQVSIILKEGGELEKAAADVVQKGLSETRTNIRRLWFVKVGDMVWTLADSPNERFKGFCRSILPRLLGTFTEVAENPPTVAHSPIVTAAQVAVAVTLDKLAPLKDPEMDPVIKKAKVPEQSLATSPKLSFILNHKLLSKLASEEDERWATRAIASTARFTQPDTSYSEHWAMAFIYLICAANFTVTCRQQARKALTAAYVRNPERIGKIMVSGLWLWLRSLDMASFKESAPAAAKTGGTRLKDIFHAITVSPKAAARTLTANRTFDEAIVKNQLVSMTVITHHEALVGVDWIMLCQKAGVDPGQLATEMAGSMVTEIRVYTGLSGRTPIIRNAAIKTAATLAFVAPEPITPLIVKLFEGDLDKKHLSGIGAQEAGIWRTPQGTMFVDVLAGKGTQVVQKSKDAETLKWEAELRAELAKKKGQERKLTSEEKGKVEEQLMKEEVVRKRVADVELRLSRGVGIIQSLAGGAPTAVEMWLGQAVNSLLKALEAGAGMIIQDRGIKAFLACAEHVSGRLGTMRPFIGIATLRALNVGEIAPELCEEPLADLTMRILYRLRFTAEQRPYDPVSLFYIMPFITLIMVKGGLGTAGAEAIDEQFILALDFLSFHTAVFSATTLPRKEALGTLVLSMQKFSSHYKSIKDCFLDLCRCIADNITPEERAVLIDAAIHKDVNIRAAALQALDADIDLSDVEFSDELWIACHDANEENSELAMSVWQTNALNLQDGSALKMIPFLSGEDKQVRGAAARALSEVVQVYPEKTVEIIDALSALYIEKAKPPAPQFDEFGLAKKVDMRDPWESRSGVALALKELALAFDSSKVVELARFLIEKGALADRSEQVRNEVIEAATSIIAAQGAARLEELMVIFETTLSAPDDGTEAQDNINEAVIILYGALGRHLESGDSRIGKVIDRLLTTLSTPSETVQYAVAECLPPLIRVSRDTASGYVQKMLDELFRAKKYAARRGAAYGLAGIVKGVGISALKDYRIMTALKAAVEDKKNPHSRQGALFAFELLSAVLGRIFEPYVIQILPMLLSSFGDTVVDVREACSYAAKACFSNLSSYGVKVILPDLLEGLEDTAWRSKKGACETLGAFAYLAPHQLAVSLPEIIPPLTTVLNDSHKDVRAAANRSLKKFGEVISNPEIKEITGILLKALSDPTKYTEPALDSLMKIQFVHYLDSPSLALVVRVLERGLGDRSATKRKAAQIIGSLAHLTDRKDLMVHIPLLVSGLKQAIVDPVPGTRATASKALGSLVEKLGEDALPDIIPGLMATLKSDTGAGDRLGSAQALSEVLAGLGTQRLEETFPTILQNASSNKSSIREGFMSLFIFLPACFGNSFSTYLSKIIPPILSGLADDVESIREVSLRAGRLLVKNFATRSIDLLLPELERGLADPNHRIRLSSVELVGDLLFNLTGISGRTEQEETEFGGEVSNSLLEVLGQEKRDKVLSALYICRCDTSGQVRLAAVGVWKALVSSPRTLKELVPTLIQIIIRRLASPNLEQRVISGQALGELIRKAGEGVLSTLLPALDDGIKAATDADSKQGICIALKELIASTLPETLEDYESTLVSIVRSALIDSDDEVREAAADAFDSLQKVIGKRAVDQVLPYLLNLLQSKEDADNALAALLTLLTEQTRSNAILPALIPTLLSPPITRFNARALASLCEVSGPAVNRRLPRIMNSLMDSIIASKDEELTEELNAAFHSVIVSVDEFDGLNVGMSEMLKLAKHDDHLRRAAACEQFARFFSATDLDYSRYHQDCIRVLLMAFDDPDKTVVKNAWTALSELTKKLKKEEMEMLVNSTRQVLRQVGVAGHNLSGFLLPKGINAILPIFLQGLMYGTPEQRTQSALAISDIIDRTSGDSLRPFVTQITGPLIRVVSERSVEVKAAILLTLNALLQKIPMHLKPFLPQLQRTFAKSLADTGSELLRTRAAKALGTLITLTPRIDPLITELVSGAKTSNEGVKDAMLKALYEVVSKVGKNMGDGSKAAILALVEEGLEENDRNAIAGARLIGVLVRHLAKEDALKTVKSRALNTAFTESSVLGLNAILLDSPETLVDPAFADETPAVISQGILYKSPFVSDNLVLAAGKFLLSDALPKSFETTKPILESLTAAIRAPPSGSVDTKRLALVVVRTISRRQYDLVRPHLNLLTPAVFACVRDMIIPVKLSAEQAFIALFQVAQKGEAVWEKYIATVEGPQKRSMNDYFRRVGMKLAAAEKERIEAGGEGLGLNSDEVEDLREVMSVGKVELDE